MYKKKNAQKIGFVNKALCFIESEFELIKLRLEYPEQFTTSTAELKSDLKLIASQADIIELATALWLSRKLTRPNGSPTTFKEILDIIKTVFNCKANDVYTKSSKQFDRKKNITPFLDELKAAMENEADERLKKPEK